MFFDKLYPEPDTYPSFRAFRLRDVNEVSGVTKWRVIHAPDAEMLALQRNVVKLLRRLQAQSWGRSPWATAALPGCSPLRNVQRHRGKRYVVALDLHSAYDNVDGARLADIICRLDAARWGYLFTESTDVSMCYAYLRAYCLSQRGSLLTGSPSSPDLFNIYADELIDRPIAVLCARWGLTYSRYLDDLTFSSDEPIGEKKRRAIIQVIQAAGFDISHRKAGVYDLTKGAIQINGIGLDITGRTFVPRHFLTKIDGILHRARLGWVKPERVGGYMGVYWSVTSRDPAQRNAREGKTLARYRDYQQAVARLEH